MYLICVRLFFFLYFSNIYYKQQLTILICSEPFSLTAEVQRSQLMTESWFHGAISRPVAENLLQNDGDFLVRESQGKPGQYVLTGLQMSTSKHLLLIDPAGVVCLILM